MDTITAIKRTKKGCFITVNEEKEIWFEESLIDKYSLYEGINLNINDILTENAPFAYEKAMDMSFSYLSYCARSEKKIQTYLSTKKFDEDTVGAVIKRLKELNYINDENYIKGYIRQKLISNPVGKKNIIEALKNEGLNEDLILKITNEQYPYEAQYENALNLVNKIFSKNRFEFIKKIKQKAYSTALRKGFDKEITINAINEVCSNFSQGESEKEKQKKKIEEKTIKLLKKNTPFYTVYSKIYTEFIQKGADPEIIKEVLDKYKSLP